MTQVAKKWIQDRAIDHTKLDSSDSYTMSGLTVKKGLTTTATIDINGNIVANSIVTSGDETNFGNIVIAQGSPDSTWAIEAGVLAAGDLQLRHVGSASGLLYLDGSHNTVTVRGDSTVSGTLNVHGNSILADATVNSIKVLGSAGFSGSGSFGSLTVTGQSDLGDTTVNKLRVTTDASVVNNAFVGGKMRVYDSLGVGQDATSPMANLEINAENTHGVGFVIKNSQPGPSQANYSIKVGGITPDAPGPNEFLIRDEATGSDRLRINSSGKVIASGDFSNVGNAYVGIAAYIQQPVFHDILGEDAGVQPPYTTSFKAASFLPLSDAYNTLILYYDPGSTSVTLYEGSDYTLDRDTGWVYLNDTVNNYLGGGPAYATRTGFNYQYCSTVGLETLNSVSSQSSDAGLQLKNGWKDTTVEALNRNLRLKGNAVYSDATFVASADATVLGNFQVGDPFAASVMHIEPLVTTDFEGQVDLNGQVYFNGPAFFGPGYLYGDIRTANSPDTTFTVQTDAHVNRNLTVSGIVNELTDTTIGKSFLCVSNKNTVSVVNEDLGSFLGANLNPPNPAAHIPLSSTITSLLLYDGAVNHYLSELVHYTVDRNTGIVTFLASRGYTTVYTRFNYTYIRGVVSVGSDATFVAGADAHVNKDLYVSGVTRLDSTTLISVHGALGVGTDPLGNSRVAVLAPVGINGLFVTTTGTGIAVYGENNSYSTNAVAIEGSVNDGTALYGLAGSGGCGVYAQGTTAGYFDGDVVMTGNVFSGALQGDTTDAAIGGVTLRFTNGLLTSIF